MASLYATTHGLTPSVKVQDTSGRRVVLVYLDPKGDSALILDPAEAAKLGAALTAAVEPHPAD